jgi:hypothetical protein
MTGYAAPDEDADMNLPRARFVWAAAGPPQSRIRNVAVASVTARSFMGTLLVLLQGPLKGE